MMAREEEKNENEIRKRSEEENNKNENEIRNEGKRVSLKMRTR
jgi:hypothetical protein